MLDIGWPEMLLVLALALMVIGPADLPKAMYGLGKAMRKMRMMSRAFQDSVDELMREAEIEDIKKEAQNAQKNLIEDIDIEEDMRDVMTATRFNPDDFDDDADDGTTPELTDTERADEEPAQKSTGKKKSGKKTSNKKKSARKPASKKKGEGK